MSAPDEHVPDRTGGAVDISIVNNKVQISSRDALTGQLDFCIHFERADAIGIGRGLIDIAEEIQIRPDEEQQRLARAYRLGQQSVLEYLHGYSQLMERKTAAETELIAKKRLQLFVALLHEMERTLTERIATSPAAAAAGREQSTN